GARHGAGQRRRAARAARGRVGPVGPRDPREEPDGAAIPQGGLQRRHRRAGRPPAAGWRRDAAVLPDRRGEGGPGRGRRAAEAGLLPVPALPVVASDGGRALTGAVSRDLSGAPRWRLWLLAARPATLPAAVVPVLVGTAAVLPLAGGLTQPLAFLAALLCSL